MREIRDEIERRVLDLLDRAEEVRADRSGHQRRLALFLPRLVDEFADSKPAEEIRACVDAILTEFDDVPVRSSCSRSPSAASASACASPECAALA